MFGIFILENNIVCFLFKCELEGHLKVDFMGTYISITVDHVRENYKLLLSKTFSR